MLVGKCVCGALWCVGRGRGGDERDAEVFEVRGRPEEG